MNTLNCEYVREIYADILHGRADLDTASAVRAHIAACADCRADVATIDALFAGRTIVPAGLHERVMGAVKTAPRSRRFAPRHLAFAATAAAALIGGTLLVDATRTPDARPGVVRKQESGLGVVTVEAAMVSGTGSLQDLTVEELEQLLGEIES